VVGSLIRSTETVHGAPLIGTSVKVAALLASSTAAVVAAAVEMMESVGRGTITSATIEIGQVDTTTAALIASTAVVGVVGCGIRIKATSATATAAVAVGAIVTVRSIDAVRSIVVVGGVCHKELLMEFLGERHKELGVVKVWMSLEVGCRPNLFHWTTHLGG